MQTDQHTFTFRHEDTARAEPPERRTFLMPFVILSFLVLPSLVVLVLTKRTAGFDALVSMGYFALIEALMWLLIPVAIIFGLLYLVRCRGLWNRLAAVLLMLVVVLSFGYVVLLQG
jgi:lysylphosphatidylglycerol synthetase-like protein (DUF2156 family)